MLSVGVCVPNVLVGGRDGHDSMGGGGGRNRLGLDADGIGNAENGQPSQWELGIR